jgi:hypothetical protein
VRLPLGELGEIGIEGARVLKRGKVARVDSNVHAVVGKLNPS